MNTQTRTARKPRNFLPHLKAHVPFASYSEDDWSPILPDQAERSSHWRGEHVLLLAIVADALKTATTRVNHSCRVNYCCHVDQRVQARRWIESESERPYGFRWICANLGTRPEAIRRKLRMADMAESGLPLFAYAVRG